MTKWPKDTQAARNAFYGDPARGEIGSQMVPVVPPFAMYYDGKRVKSISFHRLAAPALLAALREIWDFYEHDQKKIDAAGVSKYAGAYAHRMVRGSNTKWSNHAYAAALDLNAAENGLYANGNMPQPVIDAFCRQGAMWGGWYTKRKDPMHFEFVDNGGRTPKSAPPVWPVPHAPVVAMPDRDHPADVLESDRKPLLKSKIVQGATAIGVTEAGDVLSQASDAAGKVAELKGNADDIGITDIIGHLLTNPRFIVAVAVIVAVGFIIFWRWRDHS